MKSEKISKFLNYNLLVMFILTTSLIFAQEIEEVVVSGSFIPDEKRDTSEISAILDS